MIFISYYVRETDLYLSLMGLHPIPYLVVIIKGVAKYLADNIFFYSQYSLSLLTLMHSILNLTETFNS